MNIVQGAEQQRCDIVRSATLKHAHEGHRGEGGPMPQNITANDHLARLMDQRRVDLRLQWGEVAQAAKVSTAHLRKFRKGEVAISVLAAARLEQALGWTRGSMQRVLDAGELPIPPEDVTVRPAIVNAYAQVAEGRAVAYDVGVKIDLAALREKAQAEGKTVGEVMVEEGFALPDELRVPDALPVDPIIKEIEESNLSDELKAQAIRWHLDNRARIFEAERLRRETEKQKDR